MIENRQNKVSVLLVRTSSKFPCRKLSHLPLVMIIFKMVECMQDSIRNQQVRLGLLIVLVIVALTNGLIRKLLAWYGGRILAGNKEGFCLILVW
jgi:hypothetical protein